MQLLTKNFFKFQQETMTLTTPGLSTLQALNKIAQREGYKNCANLEKGSTQLSAPPYSDDQGESDLQPTTRAEVLKILQHRIQVGTDDETTLLFRNGTVWIQPRDIKANTVGLGQR